ncbi:MAG: ECF-type sigma factor [bacterium]|nr:ECF-type sigma factor [bacterium]
MDPSAEPTHDVTRLLAAARAGDRSAFEAAFTIVLRELRGIAAHLLDRERLDHTLQPTALVNEAWFKLCQQRSVAIEDRTQFLAVAAQAMRRILVDHARTKGRQKRDGGQRHALDETVLRFENNAIDLLALDEALDRLSERDERMARIVELRFFAGLDPQETSNALGIGLRTCERDWSLARAWLRRELTA